VSAGTITACATPSRDRSAPAQRPSVTHQSGAKQIDELRAKAADPRLLAALIAFLEAHEPDLLEVSEAIGVEPAALTQARRALEGGAP